MLALVRPSVVKRLHAGPSSARPRQLVGSRGVTETGHRLEPGRVKLAGEIWTRRALRRDATIEAGAKVEVFEISGATAVRPPDAPARTT